MISFSGGVRKTAYISTIKQQSFAGCKEKRPSINIPAAFFIFGGSLDKFCDLSFHYLGKVIQFYVKFRYKWLNYSVDTRKGWLVTKMRARKHFSFRGRNFKLSFSKWQERLRKRSPLRYFLKPKEDSRSSFGKRVDVLVGSFLIWLASFLVLSSLTNRPAASLALSLPLLVIEVLVLQRYRSLRERRFRLEQRLYHAGQKFLGEVSKMDPQREFCPYLRDLLAKLPGFEEVRLKGEKDQKGGQGNQGIDLEGLYQGSRVAVRCVLQEGDKKVLPDDIRDFARALQQSEYRHGLFITTGEFDTGVFSVLKESARKGVQIKPVNKYRLMDLARRAGTGVFQEDGFAGGAKALTATGRRTAVLTALRDTAFGSRKRAKSYFLYGLLLFAGYLVLKSSTALSLIYLFFAVLNFGFSAYSLLFGSQLEEIDPLEGLGQKK